MHLRFFKLLLHSQIMVKTTSVFSGWEVNVKTTFILDKWAWASCKPWERKEVAPSWLGARGWAVTLSVSRLTPNRKSSEIRPASRLFTPLPPGDWWLLFHGRTLSLSPYFLILKITTEWRQPIVQSRNIKSHKGRLYTKKRLKNIPIALGVSGAKIAE